MDSLRSGQTILHYRVEQKIGQGGMGEVYKAEDLKLGRHVAIKVLPASAMRDQTARQRFLREARSASALNHPNIVTIHAIEEADGCDFIVMEYVEGESLRENVARGRLALPQALELGAQIADALAAAHARGLIHRDIKSANILLTPRGQAKVLDFGLAKMIHPLSSDGGSEAATLSGALTDAGVIIGTIAYMSPEQTRGEALDARSDIFSLGVVLYEAVTGQLPFSGPSALSIMHEIAVGEPPPPSTINQDLPPEFDLIIQRALAKGKEQRYAWALDLAAALRSLKGSTADSFSAAAPVGADAGTPTATGKQKSNGQAAAAASLPPPVMASKTPATPPLQRWLSFKTLALSGVVVGLLIAAVFGWNMWKTRTASVPAAATTSVLKTSQVTSWTGLDLHPALSPDGNVIAYSSDHRGSFDIYLKPLTPGARELQITSDGRQNFDPAWSPDGKLLAYHSQGRGIWVVPTSGGVVKQLTEFGSHPAWSPNGSAMAFQSVAPPDLGTNARTMPPSTLWLVSAQGGEPTPLTQIGQPPGGHGSPAWSPDSQRIVFVASDSVATTIWSISVKGDGLKRLADRGGDPVYSADGRAVYFAGRGSELWKLGVAPGSGEPLGEPVKVTSPGPVAMRYLTISADGKKLAYSALASGSNLWSVPISPHSNEATGAPAPLAPNTNFRNLFPVFSPDGRKILFYSWRTTSISEIWLMESDGQNPVQLTTNGGIFPSWFPGGESLAFLTNRDRNWKLWEMVIEGRREKLRLDLGEDLSNPRMSPDGKELAFNSKKSGTINLWKVPITGGESKQLTFDKELAGFPCWSPDGKFIAFEIQRGDDTHAAIMPSSGGAPTQLTFGHGQSWTASWSPDGDKIAFAGFRNGYWNVWWVSRSTKAQKQITDYQKLNAYVRYPAWSPRGNQMVYEYAETTGNIWLMELK